MTKNEVKKHVPDVCVQKITLRNCSAIATKAKVVAESMGTGLICYDWNGERDLLCIFTSYDFKDFLDFLKPGVKVTNKYGGEFTIESEPYLENCRMCVRANGDVWFCDVLYNPMLNYKGMLQ